MEDHTILDFHFQFYCIPTASERKEEEKEIANQKDDGNMNRKKPMKRWVFFWGSKRELDIRLQSIIFGSRFQFPTPL